MIKLLLRHSSINELSLFCIVIGQWTLSSKGTLSVSNTEWMQHTVSQVFSKYQYLRCVMFQSSPQFNVKVNGIKVRGLLVQIQT